MNQQKYRLVVYTRREREDYSEFLCRSVHFGVLGSGFTPLFRNYGKLFAECGFSAENGIVSKGVKDFEVYVSGGKYVITAAEVSRENLHNGEFPVSETGRFIRWETADFKSFSAPAVASARAEDGFELVSEPFSDERVDFIEAGAVFGISEEIAERLLRENEPVVFCGLKLPESVTAASREELMRVKATAHYTDGSSHEKHVVWNDGGIDWSKPGTYEIEGKIAVRRFPFPVEEHPWGDPVITYFRKKYYYIATNDANGDTSFEIREANTPEELFAEGVRRSVILSADKTVYKNTFWAPEFHIVGGKMRIFCALTEGEGFNPQCRVMTLRDGGDMLDPGAWSAPESCVMPDGRPLGANPLGDGKNGITLDMNCFEAAQKTYVVWSFRTWAGTDSGSMLMIAETNPEKPWQLLSFPVLLSRPVYGWENNRGTDNNEGPYALVTDKKVYLSYSGGDARGQSYVVGLLTADVGADLTDVSSWKIPTAPALASGFVPGQYGCGHNAFFRDEFGDVYITYHGVRAPSDRAIRPGIRRVHFLADGTPDLTMTDCRDLPEGKDRVKIRVVVEG